MVGIKLHKDNNQNYGFDFKLTHKANIGPFLWKMATNTSFPYLKNMASYTAQSMFSTNDNEYKRAINNLTINATGKCNKSCKGCYAENYTPDALGYDLLDSIVGQAEDNFDVFAYTILGGEPLLEKESLIPLFEKYKKSKFVVFTNGTLLDERTAYSFSKSGNVYPVINIPGLEKTTDNIRGKGSFDEVRATAEGLRKNKVPFGFGSNVMSINYKEVTSDRFINQMMNMGFMFGMFFPYSHHLAADGDISLELQNENKQEYQTRFSGLKKRSLLIVDRMELYPEGACAAIEGTNINVTNDGFVTPCLIAPFKSEKFNVRNRPFADIVNDIHKKISHVSQDGKTCLGEMNLETIETTLVK